MMGEFHFNVSPALIMAFVKPIISVSERLLPEQAVIKAASSILE
jgi:hypothetical protein